MDAEVLGPKHWSERFEHDVCSAKFSQDGLVIILSTKNENGIDANLEISFEWVTAFRFMDESDMQYYSVLSCLSLNFHVFKILSGGWSNGETRQKGILDASAGVYPEYLIATNNGCIQVLSGVNPNIGWRPDGV
ncbi:hypothetical protein [Shewanella sp. 10N.286.54.B9]|uniref:hypothetical protein n=1 Tax=Shewanella sp. 10N.286.54.B9 TaxID=3229719 RepID=UPI0035531DD5